MSFDLSSSDKHEKRTALALIALACGLFAWSHWHALGLFGFSDDLSLLVDLPRLAEEGQLWTTVNARLLSAVWAGSTMWRPLPYASFALDAALWGSVPEAWRWTNLVLHVVSAALTGLLVRQLLPARPLVAALAFSVFLLMPWIPEVTVWLVGRFDGWVTALILFALVTGLRAERLGGYLLLSWCAGLFAYASKESALILLPWLLLCLWLRQGLQGGSLVSKPVWVLLLGHGFLFAGYQHWRSHLFAGAALEVYASAPTREPLQLLSQVGRHIQWPVFFASAAPWAALMVGVFAVILLLYALAYRVRVVVGVMLLMSLLVVVAIALYFDSPMSEGSGYRLYYLAGIGLAISVSVALAESVSKIKIAAVVALLVSLAAWQRAGVAEWQLASNYLRNALPILAQLRDSLPPDQYGLVMMRDSVGRVPATRNAQGALLSFISPAPPAGEEPWARLILFTPPQVNEWWQLVQEDVVLRLTKRADAPANPTRYYCYDETTAQIKEMGYWSAAADVEVWRRQWQQTVREACPNLM